MEAFRKIYPTEFYKKFLVQNVRPDGRTSSKVRKTTVSAGSITTADGSAFCKLGNTSVVCGIKAELGEVPNIKATGPRLIVNLELLPLCSPHIKPGKPSEQAQATSELLNRVGRDLLNEKDLTVSVVTPHNDKMADVSDEDDDRPKSVTLNWFIYADIYCLDYDGNVFDAALIALVAALKNFTLPQLEVDEAGSVFAVEEKGTKLKLNIHPVPITFGLFEDYVLADPNMEEEQLITGSFTVICSEQGLYSYLKAGGAPISEDVLHECIEKTKQRLKEVHEIINQALESK
jgi:exosome complex component RRP43